MTRRRVVVTGIGAVTPIGLTADGLWGGLRAERSAVAAITRFDASPVAHRRSPAQVDDFHVNDHLDAKKSKRLDRFSQFAVVAAQQAARRRAPRPRRRGPRARGRR
jgi:3-oxoacyl-[acyl-carrier-protein] synthase II